METQDGIKSIAQTGWIDGKFPGFQKWPVGADAPYDNPIQNGIWTSNPMRATAPGWVIKTAKSGYSVLIACESAYYIHCNKKNPCNDLALKFGNLAPQQTLTRRGYLEFVRADVGEIFNRINAYSLKKET